jgi:hypothetical protein
MLDRFISALVALSLALLVWLYMRSRDQEMLDNVQVPVHITLLSGQENYYDLEVEGPSQVPVSFTGPPSRIRELRNIVQRGELRVEVSLTVPADRLTENRYSDTVRIEGSDIHPPAGVIPLVIEGRNRIPVTFHRLIERRLPVRLEGTGDARFAQIHIEPAQVLVRGPQEILDHTRTIPTQPFAPPPRAETTHSPETVTAEAVPLVQEIKRRRIHTFPDTVRVRLTLQPREKLYELTEVPVQFLCPANFSLRPLFSDERSGKITIRLLGPPGEEPSSVVAYIDLSARKWETGLYEEPLKFHLPKDFQLAQSSRRLVTFQLIATEAPIKGGATSGP